MTDPFTIPSFMALEAADAKPTAAPAAKTRGKRGPKTGQARAKAAATIESEKAQKAQAATPLARPWRTSEYKHPTAMKMALERARAAQPPVVTLAATTAKEYKNNGSF